MTNDTGLDERLDTKPFDLSSPSKDETPPTVWILYKDGKPYRANTYNKSIRIFLNYNRAVKYIKEDCPDKDVQIMEYIPKF